MKRVVVVGIEDLPHSQVSLEWATRAAEQRRAVLRLVHATGLPMTAVDLLTDVVRDEARDLLDKAVGYVHEVAPAVPVDSLADPRRPLVALVDAAEDAELLVVGSHRVSTPERVFGGSLAYQVAAAAPCPVVVVPGPVPDGASGVVVGADGSADGLAAVALAAAEADATGQPLHVVHAWLEPALYASIDVYPEGLADQIRDEERVVLGESAAGLAQTYPDLVVHEELAREQAATALLRAAEHARMLVVGSRGRNALARLLLGSTSHTVVLHAPCPVMVVRTKHTQASHH